MNKIAPYASVFRAATTGTVVRGFFGSGFMARFHLQSWQAVCDTDGMVGC